MMDPTRSARSSILRLAARLVALYGVLALPAVGLQHPNQAQGFQPEHAYQLGNLDSINEFNGNLTLQIPLGSYPVDGGLSFGLTLTYTGNVWDYELDKNLVDGGYYLRAVPRKSSNAGLGWQVSLGAIEPADSNSADGYRSPDGAVHPLDNSLHLGGATHSGYEYTKDSNYLRYSGSIYQGTLEFPDGTRRYFERDPVTGDERPTRIDDHFGNSVTIQYPSAGILGYPDIVNWKITDSHQRTEWVYFKQAPASSGQYPRGVVDRVVVTAFGGQHLTYRFIYSTPTITRGKTDRALTCAYASPTVSVPLLTSVRRTDAPQMMGDNHWYDFTYDQGPYHGTCTGTDDYGLTQTDNRSGVLLSVTLPTYGKLQWSWGYYIFPQRSEVLGGVRLMPTGGFGLLPFSMGVGVTTRQTVKMDGSVEGTWTYQHAITSDPPAIARASTTTVTDPLGNETVHYFTLMLNPGSTGARRRIRTERLVVLRLRRALYPELDGYDGNSLSLDGGSPGLEPVKRRTYVR